jgi:hypothetical protein
MNVFLKGKLEAGDKVNLTAQIPSRVRQLLADLDGSTVLSVNGDKVVLRSADGLIEVEMHRRYFCRTYYVGHPDDPCPVCGYQETE